MLKLKYIIIAIIVVFLAFMLGYNTKQVDKYNYLDLNSITYTDITCDEVIIYTSTGDYYSFYNSNK